MSKKQAINKLFSDFIETLNLVFADDFYKNTFELKKVKEIMDKWYFDFKKEKTLINICLQDI